MAVYSKNELETLLAKHGWNQDAVARELGVSTFTIHREVSRHGILKKKPASEIPKKIPQSPTGFIYSKDNLKSLMEKHQWNLSSAAREIQVSSTHVKYLLEKYGIDILPGTIRRGPPDKYTKEIVENALRNNNWYQEPAARELGTPPSYLQVLIKKLGIKIPEDHRGSGRRPKYTKEGIEALLEDHGWNFDTAASELGITFDGLMSLIYSYGIRDPGGHRRFSKSRKKYNTSSLYKLMVECNWDYDLAAQKLGIATSTMRGLLLRYGINTRNKLYLPEWQSSDPHPIFETEDDLIGVGARSPKYTKGQLEELLENHDWNQSNLARELGTSNSAVSQLVKAYGIEIPSDKSGHGRKIKYTKEQLENMLSRNNWDQSAVARDLGTSKQNVNQMIERLGVEIPSDKKRKGRNKKYDANELRELIIEHSGDLNAVAIELGVDRDYLSKILSRYHIGKQ